MPSSTRLGSRFRSRLMRAYSSSLSPCSRTVSGVMAVMAPLCLAVLGTSPASGGGKRRREVFSSPVYGGGGLKGRWGERACANASSRQRIDQSFEQSEPIRWAQQRIAGAFRMRHQPQHVAFFIQNAGDVTCGAVWMFAAGIAEHDRPFSFQAVERVVVGKIIPLAMGHRIEHSLLLPIATGEHGLCFLDLYGHGFANEF